MSDLPQNLDRMAARALLGSQDVNALTCLLCLSLMVGDDIFDEDGQPADEETIREYLGSDSANVLDENITKAVGLLHAISGPEFVEDRTHFKRFVSAIIEGDPFHFDREEDEPTIPEVYWALYQVNFITEDDIIQELGPAVQDYISKLADDEAEDNQALAQAIAEEGDDPENIEPYVSRILVFRREDLANELTRLRCPAEWVREEDPDLADAMVQSNSSAPLA